MGFYMCMALMYYSSVYQLKAIIYEESQSHLHLEQRLTLSPVFCPVFPSPQLYFCSVIFVSYSGLWCQLLVLNWKSSKQLKLSQYKESHVLSSQKSRIHFPNSFSVNHCLLCSIYCVCLRRLLSTRNNLTHLWFRYWRF